MDPLQRAGPADAPVIAEHANGVASACGKDCYLCGSNADRLRKAQAIGLILDIRTYRICAGLDARRRRHRKIIKNDDVNTIILILLS